MILPIFSLYAEGLDGVTPTLIGLALGVYGLTMALFQIPFGMLSDRFGRKPIIAAGLLLFAIGSVVAAMADSIWGVIIGRAIQGSGAIAAAMMALLADLTREEERTKAMAILGVSIGMSFTLALVIGPFMNNVIGVDGIFWVTACLAIAGLIMLFVVVPTPDPIHVHGHRDVQAVPAQLKSILSNLQLLRLDFGIMTLHALMMAMFTALPFILRDNLGMPSSEHAWFYLPVLILSVFGMVPMIIIAEKKHKTKQVFIISISLLIIAELMLGTMNTTILNVSLGLFLFFVGYNVLEASLPSLISRMAPADGKGTAMGVYSTSQFFGAFLGGAGGGWLYGQWGFSGVFFACASIATVWVLIALSMRVPSYLATKMFHITAMTQQDAALVCEKLLDCTGVSEAKVIIEDCTAYLKVDRRHFNPEEVEAILKN